MKPVGQLRLGVNIDHVATVRNARGGAYPDPLRAAQLAQEAGADGITAHLREDRRHISDADIDGLMDILRVPLNFEMAATAEMQEIALRHKPHAICLVPEKREERTTEGGLEVAREENQLAYCDLHAEGRFAERDEELVRLGEMASFAHSLGLEVHAGHGLTYDLYNLWQPFPK